MASLRRMLCAALVACSPHTTAPQAAPPAPVVTPAPAPAPVERQPAGPVTPGTGERYIVAEADAARFYVGHYNPATAYFTPAEAEVAAFERDLPAFLADNADAEARAIAGKLPTYRRQFVGVVREEGRLVFGNYFCDKGTPVRVPVMVDDGGPCYFNVFYDPQRGGFVRLSINGSG